MTAVVDMVICTIYMVSHRGLSRAWEGIDAGGARVVIRVGPGCLHYTLGKIFMPIGWLEESTRNWISGRWETLNGRNDEGWVIGC